MWSLEGRLVDADEHVSDVPDLQIYQFIHDRLGFEEENVRLLIAGETAAKRMTQARWAWGSGAGLELQKP